MALAAVPSLPFAVQTLPTIFGMLFAKAKLKAVSLKSLARCRFTGSACKETGGGTSITFPTLRTAGAGELTPICHCRPGDGRGSLGERW